MRQIGTLPSQQHAELLADYLLTEGIPAQTDQDGANWAIWVREENQLDQAKRILDEFRQRPDEPKYKQAVSEAAVIRTKQSRQRAKQAKQMVDMRRQWNQPLRRRAPLVFVLIALSVFVSLITAFGDLRQGEVYNALLFTDLRVFQQTGDGMLQIKHGQLWRLVTPIFLHGNLLHLGFNMLWLYSLGVQIEVRRGTVGFGVMVLLLAVVSNLAQYLLGGGPHFLGMSGVVFGLFGYVWLRQRIAPTDGFFISEFNVFIMLFVLVLGFTGSLNGVAGGGIANYAHLGGLLGGVAVGAIYPRR
jgi:GlpG protein